MPQDVPIFPLCLGLFLFLAGSIFAATSRPFFKIKIVDSKSGRGVPLVKLETVNHVIFYTDSAGVAVLDDPGLMNQDLFLYLSSPGYTIPKDGFGYAGIRVHATPGGQKTVPVKRSEIAERLYRITGEGIYRDSVISGAPVPIRHPLLDGGVLGQDSVQAIPYHGKLYWFWGDTEFANYPLGNFHTSGAVSDPPHHGGLAPDKGVNLRYFCDAHGRARAICPMPEPGPVWIDGLLTLSNARGEQRMFARFTRMKNLGTLLEQGLVEFNDRRDVFEKVAEFDTNKLWQCPRGHPIRIVVHGIAYFYFPTPFCTVRVKADLADLTNQADYEALTLPPSGEIRGSAPDTALPGHPYVWLKGGRPITQEREGELIRQGVLSGKQALLQVKDARSGRRVILHSGSIEWNAYRKKWILIAVQRGGSSFLGEVWYAEADSPLGPWRRAIKIATHPHDSFYNPCQHRFFDEQGGRYIFFEGTYAKTFSGNPTAVPRYDYNQIMYRLDLADPRLHPGPRLKPSGKNPDQAKGADR